MGWLQQSYKQSQCSRHPGGSCAGREIVAPARIYKVAHRRPCIRLAAIAATALLGPLDVLAFEPPPVVVQDDANTAKGHGTLRSMNEDELRRESAQGLLEDRLFRSARYASGSFGVDVLGDMATWLNPVLPILEPNTFKDAVFNPINPYTLVDKNGSAVWRYPKSEGAITVENIRVSGGNGTNYGSVTIRDASRVGTTIRVTQRRY